MRRERFRLLQERGEAVGEEGVDHLPLLVAAGVEGVEEGHHHP